MPDLEPLLQERPHGDVGRERSREVVRERSPHCVVLSPSPGFLFFKHFFGN